MFKNDELNRSRILIVEDTRANINILVSALKDDYKLGIATSGSSALQYIDNHLPDLILLDIMMPEMDGYEVCERLKTNERTRDIPILFVTAMTEAEDKARGFELGGVDYITKPFQILEVKARVRTHLALKLAREQLKNHNLILEERVRERTQELRNTQIEVVYRLGRAAEYRDNETGYHIKRMSRYCALLGKALGMNEEECEILLNASSMHDIGKIGIPDGILLKPGRLDPNERLIMQSHTRIGAGILAGNSCKLLQMAETIALTHHEKWNGTGYPSGLAGNDIPLVGRITALSDVFDALTSKRPYKDAWSVEDAVAEIVRSSGIHFDSALVDLFLEIQPEMQLVKDRFMDKEDFSRNGGSKS